MFCFVVNGLLVGSLKTESKGQRKLPNDEGMNYPWSLSSEGGVPWDPGIWTGLGFDFKLWSAGPTICSRHDICEPGVSSPWR